MPLEPVMEELLDRACPSIQYRLRAEILRQPRADADMLRLQGQILEDAAVKTVMGWQQPDGWLGRDFHGADGIECGIRLLCEKGVEKSNPLLGRALDALATCGPARLEGGIGRVGRWLDELRLGGSEMIRAAVLAYAGVEDLPIVQAQVERALAGFAAVLEVASIADLFDLYRGQRVLKPGLAWPGIYHLRLLAYTVAWRTPQRVDKLAECVQRLAQLSPIPEFNARHGSQLIAPASFCMHDFDPDLSGLNDAGWMMEFHRLELLARLGVIDRIPALQRQAAALEEILGAGGGFFCLKLNHASFKQWGAYTGLMLEPDWRAQKRRMYDLTFRSLLILNYAKPGKPE